MPSNQLLVETIDGAVEVRAFATRIEAVLDMERARDRTDARRLTIVEDGQPLYSLRREASGWREESPVA